MGLAASQTGGAPPTTVVLEIHPEWAGTWANAPGMGTNFSSFQGPRDPKELPSIFPEEHGPFTPELQAAYLARRERQKRGESVYDPMLQCIPQGMPSMMAPVHPSIMAVTPTVITWMTHEMNNYREIYIDGRAHPKHLKPSLTGHSIGHWEGNTLVIDTVAISTKSALSRGGLPHSDQLHLQERVHMRNDGQLEWQITAIDPAVLTAPWTMTKRYVRVDEDDPKQQQVGEYVCEDNRETEPRAPAPPAN